MPVLVVVGLWGAVLSGCIGVNTAKLPNQEIYADDGERREFRGDVGFAVVGDSRDPLPLEGKKTAPSFGSASVREAIVADISEAIQEEEVRFITHLGDMVRLSNTASWKAFSKQWSLVMAGTEIPESGSLRVRSVPVAGDHDAAFDRRLKGWGAAFTGVGAEIGYGRVGSWYTFDVRSGDHTWRLVVLDTNKKALGSRWNEQTNWLKNKALEGEFDSLLVFMHHPLLTLAVKGEPNAEGAPHELLDIIDDVSKVGALKAVFAAHSRANEVFLPGGKYGELYVNTVGGSPAASLARWGEAPQVGYEDLRLEPIYDLALVREFGRWAEAKEFPEVVIEKGRGDGAWEGFVAQLDAGYFPVHGWWNVHLQGAELDLAFRMVGAGSAGKDASVKPIYSVHLAGREGWKIGK